MARNSQPKANLRGLIRRLFGFGLVSAVAVVVTQAVLLAGYSGFGWPAVTANVVAVCVAALPAYYGNRRWVWSKTDRHSVTREILPFWAYSLAGLAISSLLVAMADRLWSTAAAVGAANLTGFGVLWIGKFVLCDRVLFRRPQPAASGRT